MVMNITSFQVIFDSSDLETNEKEPKLGHNFLFLNFSSFLIVFQELSLDLVF